MVEAAGGEDAPVEVAGLEGDAVGAGGGEGFARAVPAVDGLAVVGAYVARVGFDHGGVEEVAGGGAGGEVDGEEGAVFAFVGDEGEAGGAEGVVDADVVGVHAVVV